MKLMHDVLRNIMTIAGFQFVVLPSGALIINARHLGRPTL